VNVAFTAPRQLLGSIFGRTLQTISGNMISGAVLMLAFNSPHRALVSTACAEMRSLHYADCFCQHRAAHVRDEPGMLLSICRMHFCRARAVNSSLHYICSRLRRILQRVAASLCRVLRKVAFTLQCAAVSRLLLDKHPLSFADCLHHNGAAEVRHEPGNVVVRSPRAFLPGASC
jgi:hypothetical protein